MFRDRYKTLFKVRQVNLNWYCFLGIEIAKFLSKLDAARYIHEYRFKIPRLGSISANRVRRDRNHIVNFNFKSASNCNSFSSVDRQQ